MTTYDDHCTALAIALAAGTPTLLWGGPGIGKTSVIGQIAAHNGWHLETVIASICDPTDFKGMPREADGRTVFSAPDWGHRIAEAKGGVVFLDEISTAAPSVQAALLRPVLEKVVGDLVLPADTRFVAAANPPGEAADGWELSAPLANRFVHLDWPIVASVVSRGLAFGWEQIDIPRIDLLELERTKVQARIDVGSFLNARPHLAHALPSSSAERGRAWPSPRSWEVAAELVAHAEAAGASDEVTVLLVAGSVGAPAAREFFAWRRALDLPDIEKVLADGGTLDVPATPDKVVAICSALVVAIKGNSSRARCDAAVNGVLATLAEAGHIDLCTVALSRIREEVLRSGARINGAAIGQFADLAEKMGVLGPDAGRAGGRTVVKAKSKAQAAAAAGAKGRGRTR